MKKQPQCTTTTTQLHHKWLWGPTQPPMTHHHTTPTVTRATQLLWTPWKWMPTNENDPPPSKMNARQWKRSPTSENECPPMKMNDQQQQTPTNKNEHPLMMMTAHKTTAWKWWPAHWETWCTRNEESCDAWDGLMREHQNKHTNTHNLNTLPYYTCTGFQVWGL